MPRQPERDPLRLHDPHPPPGVGGPHPFGPGASLPALTVAPPGVSGPGGLVNGNGPPPPALIPAGPGGAPNGHGPSPVISAAPAREPALPILAKLAQANETTWLLLGMSRRYVSHSKPHDLIVRYQAASQSRWAISTTRWHATNTRSGTTRHPSPRSHRWPASPACARTTRRLAAAHGR
jgi:hypothetical protein